MLMYGRQKMEKRFSFSAKAAGGKPEAAISSRIYQNAGNLYVPVYDSLDQIPCMFIYMASTRLGNLEGFINMKTTLFI